MLYKIIQVLHNLFEELARMGKKDEHDLKTVTYINMKSCEFMR